jgi:hypothetical protein
MTSKHSPQIYTFARALRTRRVLFVIGAGVSRQTNQRAPTWPELVRSGIKYASDHVLEPDRPADWARMSDPTATVDEALLVATAQQITESLDGPYGGLWRDWLDTALGRLKPTNKSLLTTIDSLKVPIASCNYDTLAEQIAGRDTVTWREPGEIQRLLYQAPENAASKVIHLHGVFNRPDTVVLGTESYTEITGDPSFQDLLRALSWSHLIVFIGIGAGLSDPNIGALRSWMRTSLSVSTEQHLMLVREDDYDRAVGVLAGSARILPLVYGKRFQDLSRFLKKVLKQSARLSSQSTSHGSLRSPPSAPRRRATPTPPSLSDSNSARKASCLKPRNTSVAPQTPATPRRPTPSVSCSATQARPPKPNTGSIPPPRRATQPPNSPSANSTKNKDRRRRPSSGNNARPTAETSPAPSPTAACSINRAITSSRSHGLSDPQNTATNMGQTLSTTSSLNIRISQRRLRRDRSIFEIIRAPWGA